MGSKETVYSGISMGCALAMILSHARENSYFWIIIHGLLSWIYVIWHIIFT